LGDIWGLFMGGKSQNPGEFEYVNRNFRFYCSFLCRLSYIFTAFDKNHDGQFDFNEFILAAAAVDKTDMTSRLEFGFDM
jgi:hypothetical protein